MGTKSKSIFKKLTKELLNLIKSDQKGTRSEAVRKFLEKHRRDPVGFFDYAVTVILLLEADNLSESKVNQNRMRSPKLPKERRQKARI